ncbi:YajG family lipoprotein [uncultured Photobacterium sp.]|uniref:YajG family lipoprotein n=1 Tax=uncultured Photobacterium sp. TaxID=173973 RepID=UPI002617B2D5|nr:YajG family lipoprotein [uncultured Photobacterium sp.]
MIKKYVVLVSALVLSACAATPPAPVALMPTAVFTSQPWAKNKTLNLTCVDQAPNSYIAVIDNGSTENVQVIQPQQPLSLTLRQALAQQLTGQGFSITNNAASTMAVKVEKALITVKQGLMTYNMRSELQLQLMVNTPDGQFTKRYSGRSSREDALTASNKDIATSMNKLMNSVLNEIANDSELNKYLKENV